MSVRERRPAWADTARLAALCYVVTILAGAAALFLRGPAGTAANAVAMLAYVAVTLLFARVFAAVHTLLARVAAVVGLAGCAASALAMVGVTLPVNPLAIFGVYCLVIGWLAAKSTFVPSAIGVFLMIGGASWLTFAWPGLARALSPYNFAPGILAETLLTVWLLIYGADGRRAALRTSPAGHH